jgi:CHAT domain-containing protein
MPSVARRVVLSACEAGRSSGALGAETFGLAHALVVAGSEAVIAPVRPVADALAEAIGREFHRSASADPDEALRAAQLGVARATPAADWAAYRVLQP